MPTRAMPDALETAAQLDAKFARTRRLVGPLHGVVIAIKDQYDTFDMRTTSGGDAFWANDRPPDDATFVKRLRDAGAIIIAKANMGEYAAGGMTGTRSSFGGTMCNAYDTERDPGASSGGSGMAVAANFVTCAIGEETGTSVREPAKNNNTVGLAPTRELVSADGMIQRGITTRVGPICRTRRGHRAASSTPTPASIPKDELTAFSIGRKPIEAYDTAPTQGRLDGYRIGVVREYMDKSLFTVADAETIDIVDRAIGDLRALGATIVDPGPTRRAVPELRRPRTCPSGATSSSSASSRPCFPGRETGAPTADHIATLLDMYFDPTRVPHNATGQPSHPQPRRRPAPTPATAGTTSTPTSASAATRRSRALTDLVTKANFWNDPAIPNRRRQPDEHGDADGRLASASALQTRFTLQTVVFHVLRGARPRRRRLPDGEHPAGDPDRRRRSRRSTTAAPGCGRTSTAAASRR